MSHKYRVSKLNKATLSIVSLLILSACNDDSSSKGSYEATITYTEHNVPHIKADSYSGLGYGIGYAQAEDNLCTLSEQLMKLKSQKSRYLGVGENYSNFLSDAGYLALGYPEQANALYADIPADEKALLEGYAKGFNQLLSERATTNNYPSPCRNAEWVTPITAQDLLAYQLDIAALASSRNFIAAIAAATPPEAIQASRQLKTNFHLQLDTKTVFTSEGIGSNGWALGEDKVENAKSALLGNPHFPWDGELRFYEQHLTIPGEMDVTGVGMIGLPAVVIGFNQNLGWTHTVSQSKRFTLYQLDLHPQDPLRYSYDGEYRDITSKTFSVTVKQADGSLVEVPHTVYYSHFGPIVNLASISPTLGWTSSSAITFRDANSANTRMLSQWLAMGKAKSKQEFFDAFADNQGIPWVNTLMISDEGTASYIDGTQVPQLSAAAEGYWALASQSPQLAPIWQDGSGNVLLPGNSSVYEWVDSGNAGAPGLVPFANAPQQTRTDYEYNANSSYWLSNLDAPLEGFSLMYGPDQTIRSPRTRYNAQLISDDSGTGLSGADGRFSLEELKSVATHNGSLFSREFRNELVSRCTLYPSIQVDGQPFNLTPACNALSAWDGTYNLQSTGAQIMREFLASFMVSGHRSLNDELFEVPFNPLTPSTTPSGLKAIDTNDVDNDPILQALATATNRLSDAGIALDAPLGSIQYVIKAQGKTAIPITGGNSYEGVFNMAESSVPSRSTSELATVVVGAPRSDSPLTDLDEDGSGSTARYRINYGSSFVFALEFNETGPNAQMFLSYSQSHDPESDFFDDQTQLYSELEWRDVLFINEDIEANTIRKIELD
ncbi:penicillin acylase family protein [Vibrio sp. YYF0003]|uniref:penicillin acylase family protein n=1 Tax=Vibrio sp. YYF0003 TaxID=3116646 RepID=UPI002EAC780B|nr:penicillin acylase family protein [Vibrio sp. YYF0003]